MKPIAAFPLLALTLTACQPYGYDAGYPQPYPQEPQGYPDPAYPGPPMPPGQPYPGPGQPSYPAGEATYRAIGTEPFWDLEIGNQLIFTDRGNDVSVSDPAPPPVMRTDGRSYRSGRLEVNIVHRQCNDGMSDRSYPDTVDVRVDGRQRYRGCGGPIEYFNQTDETGQSRYPDPGNYTAPGTYPPPGPPYAQPGSPMTETPQGIPVANLTGTNWRILSINGTRTPASNFYINFMPDQLGAKFGCNSMSGRYSQAGSILSVGAITSTRMACPDMSFENQGSRILGQPLTIGGFAERITLSNDRGTIELARAR